LSNGNIGFGTETNPTQGRFVFSLNASTGFSASGVSTNGLNFIGVDGASGGYAAFVFGAAGINQFMRADGTAASPTALVAGDLIGGIVAGGYTGATAGWTAATKARALFIVTEPVGWSNLLQGTGLEIDTTAAGAAVRAQAMLIKAGVIIGSGTTDPGANNLIVGGTIAATLANTATTSAVCYNTGTGLFTYDGTIGTCSISDERLKAFDRPIIGALDRLMQIASSDKFGYFHWTAQGYGTGEQIGMGAQTVERLFPEFVSTGADGYKSLAYDKLTVPIIAAMREMQIEIDDLKRRVK
jgi:hypothetical protein